MNKTKKYLVTKPNLLKDIKIEGYLYEHYIRHNNNVYGIITIDNKEIKKEDWSHKIKMREEDYQKIKTYKLIETKLTEKGNKITNYENAIILTVNFEEKQLEKIIEKSIEVTNNKYFSDMNLTTSNSKKVILEGSDFSGKTTLAKKLVNRGVFVQERDLENFSYWIRDFIKEPGKIIEEKIKDKEELYIVMTMSDEVLSKRIKTRENLTEFDKIAAKSNEIYKNLNLKLKNVKRIHIESNEEDSLRKFEGAMEID